jgi:hypothetical protein
MFIGSIYAGNRPADLLSIVSSAARNDLDVFVYVKDVLDLPRRKQRLPLNALRRLEVRASRGGADLPPRRAAAPCRGQVDEAGQSPCWPPLAALLAGSRHPGAGGKGMAVAGAHSVVGVSIWKSWPASV